MPRQAEVSYTRHHTPGPGYGRTPFFTCFSAFGTSMTTLELGFPFVTDARDPSTGLPVRQSSDGPAGFGEPRVRGPELAGYGPPVPPRGVDLPPRGMDRGGAERGGEAFPVRQPALRPPRPSGRHR